MPRKAPTQTELLQQAAEQLERATAATTTLLDRNDEKVHHLAERLSVLETKVDSAHARLKRVEAIVFGTLDNAGLKERFHYADTEIIRIQKFLEFIDKQFKTGLIKGGKLTFWSWHNPNFLMTFTALVSVILIFAGMLIWKYYGPALAQ